MLHGGACAWAPLHDWQRRGILEPSAVKVFGTVAAHPEWLRLDGRTVVVLGAGSEMGPLEPLLRWGGTVVAVDLPRRSCGGAC